MRELKLNCNKCLEMITMDISDDGTVTINGAIDIYNAIQSFKQVHEEHLDKITAEFNGKVYTQEDFFNKARRQHGQDRTARQGEDKTQGS